MLFPVRTGQKNYTYLIKALNPTAKPGIYLIRKYSTIGYFFALGYIYKLTCKLLTIAVKIGMAVLADLAKSKNEPIQV